MVTAWSCVDLRVVESRLVVSRVACCARMTLEEQGRSATSAERAGRTVRTMEHMKSSHRYGAATHGRAARSGAWRHARVLTISRCEALEVRPKAVDCVLVPMVRGRCA